MNNMTDEETAVCRGCGMKLNGKPYYMGGIARHPKTGEQCNASFWGGYVCSDRCDDIADERQKESIDAHVTSNRY